MTLYQFTCNRQGRHGVGAFLQYVRDGITDNVNIEAGRMLAIGSLIGYAIGSINMVNVFGTSFGNTQFKQMTVVAALSLLASVLVTSCAVQERVLLSTR